MKDHTLAWYLKHADYDTAQLVLSMRHGQEVMMIQVDEEKLFYFIKSQTVMLRLRKDQWVEMLPIKEEVNRLDRVVKMKRKIQNADS